MNLILVLIVVIVVVVLVLVDTIDGFRYKNIIRNHYHNRHYHQLLALSSTTKTGVQKERPLNRLATLLKKKKGKSVVEDSGSDGIEDDTNNVNHDINDTVNVKSNTDNDTNDTNNDDNDINDINANNTTYDIDDLELLMNEGLSTTNTLLNDY